MTTPVTGPFTTSNVSTRFTHDRKVVYRQRQPYNLFLSGTHEYSHWLGGTNSSGNEPVWTGLVRQLNSSSVTVLRSRVVSRVLDALTEADDAALGVALVQYGQARATVVQRFRQLLDFSMALRYGNVPSMRRALRVNSDLYRNRLPQMAGTRELLNRGWRGRVSDYGGTWLEWSWGVAPLIQDIEAATRILQSDLAHEVVLSTTDRFTGRRSMGVSSSEPFETRLAFSPNPPWGTGQTWERGKVFYKISGKATLKNPNRLLYNQLGLDDPLAIGFEVIPWSFLLSWVSNVEVFLRNWSSKRDLFAWEGLGETMGKTSIWDRYSPDSIAQHRDRYSVHYVVKTPLASIPRVDFHFKPLRFSMQRGANAVALLSTFLRSASFGRS